MNGYGHRSYAFSLAEFGEPIELPGCGGWILKRPVPQSPFFDGMGCYPLFCCQDGSQLGRDLEEAGRDLVCLSLVAGPLGEPSPQALSGCFGEGARPFKQHFIVELGRAPEAFVSAHHRRNARKALQAVEVEVCPDPFHYYEEWVALYGLLIQKHHIRGIPAFSREAFYRQLAVPGLVMLRAVRQGVTVGITLWYRMGETAYYHLAAYDEDGYRLRASFALFWEAIRHFTRLGLRRLSLGAGAGLHGGELDGLSRFKQGWATGTRTAYFCSRVFQPERYAQIVRARGLVDDGYFPAYRRGEFG